MKLRALGALAVAASTALAVGPTPVGSVPKAYGATLGVTWGGSTTITEGDGPASINSSSILVTGNSFDSGFIDFSIASQNSSDRLSLETVGSATTSSGAVSVVGTSIYLGNGTTADNIGSIDATRDGEDGNSLRVNFVNSFPNASFEEDANGATSVTGWRTYNQQIRLGTDSIEGVRTVDTGTYPNLCGGAGDDDDGVYSSWNAAAYWQATVSTTTASAGSNSLSLALSASANSGGWFLRGPAAASSSFQAAAGDTISFDWRSIASGDRYVAFGYLLNTATGVQTEILDEVGASGGLTTAWATKTVTIPASGTYKFVFVAGAYNGDCGQQGSGALYIDNVVVVGDKATATVVQELARLVRYQNTSDTPPSSRTVTLLAEDGSGGTQSDTSTIVITPVNDAPSIDGDGSTTSIAVTVTETDISSTDNPLANLTGTLSGYDPDLDSPTFSFGISGGTTSGSEVSKVGTYGTLTVNSSSGAYTYVPNMSAIKPLDTGDDPVDSFALTVSDGSLSGAGTLNITIDSFTDTEPSAPTVTAVIPGNQFVTVLFDPPTSIGGNAITDYEWSTDGVNFVSLGSVPSGAFTIDALSSDGTSPMVNGTSYPITIRATNGQLSPVSNSMSGTPAAGPAINTPTIQSFEPSASLTAIDEDFTISGFGPSDNILVTIGLSGQAAGTQFALVNFEDSGASEGSGYSSYTDGTAVTEFALTGSQTEVNGAIRGLKLETGSSRSNFTVNVSASVVSGSVVQSGTTQSFYEYVSDSGITWEDARDAAELKTFAGVSGYLVTITSAAENLFVKDRISGATNIWIGATDSTEEGVWRWMTGPEGQNGGTVFWTVDDGQITYDSWSSGEPNDWGSGEDAAVTNWGSANGTWNDLPLSYGSVGGYVVEYSEWNGQTFTSSAVVKANSAVSMGGPVLSATAGATSVALSWAVPTRSGQTITSYSVTSSPSVAGVSSCTGSTTSCTVSGLENGTEYTFIVTATWSDSATSSSNAVSARPVSAPTSPTTTSRTTTPTVVVPPVVVPAVPPRVTTPPGTAVPVVQSGPVLTRGVVPVPPKAPTVVLGGRPTLLSVTVPTTTQLDVKAGRLSLGVKVLEDQGTISEAPDGTTQIAVKKGASATITGTGFKPAATVQVFLPLDGDNAKELTRIPVAADGSFDGSAPFATRPNEAPLPVGKQVLQLVSLDTDGNQVVVEMTVNIAQGAPAPEANRIAGSIPAMSPGQSIATSGGEPVPVTITPVSDQKLAVVEGDGWSMAVNVNSDQGGVEAAEGGALLKLVRNESALVSGSGFMPGTRADVWLFSDPTLLGTVTIDENGEFTGEVNIDPNMIPVGQHTLQLQGVGEDGYVKAANMGVLVDDPAEAVTDTATASLTFLWWIVAAVLVVLVLVVILASRRRRQA